MSTTALAVELLVIGYQALVWLTLAACLLPLCDDTLLRAMKEWKELLAVASVVPAYTLGAIMNGIASKVTDRLEGRLIEWRSKACFIKGRSQQPSEARAAILIQKPEAIEHVMGNYVVPRLLRSTIINVFLIGVFSFIHLSSSDATSPQLLLAGVLIVLGIAATVWAWYESAENYYIHLWRTYDALKKPETES